MEAAQEEIHEDADEEMHEAAEDETPEEVEVELARPRLELQQLIEGHTERMAPREAIEQWVRRSPRIRKAKTKEERIVAQLNRHPVLGPCNCKLKSCCFGELTPEICKTINKKFWTSTYLQQTSFVSRYTRPQTIKRRNGKPLLRKKQFMLSYSLPIGNLAPVKVCKKMFQNTLGVKTFSLLARVYKAEGDNREEVVESDDDQDVEDVDSSNGNLLNSSIVSEDDKRGKGKKKHAFSAEKKTMIRAHVESFRPSVSHYRREHAPNRRYLPPEITIKMMHDDLISKHPNDNCCYSFYRQLVSSMNIAFTCLGAEECDQCDIMKKHTHDDPNDGAAAESCEECKIWRKHLNDAKQAREEYRKDRETNCSAGDVAIYSADMQKVVIVPIVKKHPKLCAFVPRLVVFNETFVPLGGQKSQNKTLAVIWHEGMHGRKGDDVASAFFGALSRVNQSHVIIWCDNCTGQNKNFFLFHALVHLANQEKGPDIIELKFLTKGHTAMSADSFHAAIERKKAKAGNVFTVGEFEDIVQSSASNVEIVRLEDSFQWKNNRRTGKNMTLPLLREIKHIKFMRGKTTVQAKVDWTDEQLTEYNIFRERDIREMHVTPGKKPPRGISAEKKSNILQKLGPLIGERGMRFYESIVVNNKSEDLLSSEGYE